MCQHFILLDILKPMIWSLETLKVEDSTARVFPCNFSKFILEKTLKEANLAVLDLVYLGTQLHTFWTLAGHL